MRTETQATGSVSATARPVTGTKRNSSRRSFLSLLLWIALLLALAGLFRALLASDQQPPASPPPSPHAKNGQYTIRVAVEMVVLHATVENRKGVHVSDLTKENFQVYEDRVLQQIKTFIHEDIPVTVGLVVDNSGSMRPKRADVTAAALAFARSSNPSDEMFVVNFNENVSFGLAADTPFTDQVPQLELALSRIKADGRTALYDAVAAALDHLKRAHRDKKVLIVITDGGDNASSQTLDAVTDMAIKSDAIVYAIGLFDEVDPDRNPRALKRLATATGGEAFLPESLQDVLPVCEHIAHDIRTQYAITYLPANQKQDGTYRAIQVKAKTPGFGRLSVRTRPGYYAPNPPPAPPMSINGVNTEGHEERR